MAVIAIDFDGTSVAHQFPGIGKDIGAQKVLKQLTDKGHQLILWTMRCNHPEGFIPKSEDKSVTLIPGRELDNAVKWFEDNKIPLYGIQTNPTQSDWTSSPKVWADLIIDDTALGTPLIYEYGERPYVDWIEVEVMLKQRGWL